MIDIKRFYWVKLVRQNNLQCHPVKNIIFIYILSNSKTMQNLYDYTLQSNSQGAAVAELLSSWLAEQEDRGSISGLAT